jgi:hypothetical protein
MRRGKLLAEKDPLRLLEELGCEYLEDAFLQLCKEDELISEEVSCLHIYIYLPMKLYEIMYIIHRGWRLSHTRMSQI